MAKMFKKKKLGKPKVEETVKDILDGIDDTELGEGAVDKMTGEGGYDPKEDENVCSDKCIVDDVEGVL